MQTNWRRARIALVAVFVGFVHLTIALPTFAQSGDPFTDPAAPDAGDTELYLPALANGDPPVEPLDSDGASAELNPTAADNSDTPALDAVGSLANGPGGFEQFGQLFLQGHGGIPNTPASREYTGYAVAAGDFNGDGYQDMAAGIPGETGGGALLLLLYGSQYGLESNGHYMIQPASAGLPADALRLDKLGWSVAAGDFNGDGYADLAAGAPEYLRQGATEWSGAVLILYGSANGITTAGSRIFHQGQEGVAGTAEPYESMGWSVATGDFNADGYTDLASGAYRDDEGYNDQGSVVLLYGSSSGITDVGSQIFTQATAGVAGDPEYADEMGYSVAAGDINGDGYADLAVGIGGEDDTLNTFPNQLAGAVLVLFGSLDGLKAQYSQVLVQPPTPASVFPQRSALGSSVAIGDFNADGFGDIAAGAPGFTVNSATYFGGAVLIYTGSATGAVFHRLLRQGDTIVKGTLAAGELTGAALASGDFNDDGFSDLAIGAPGEGTPSLYYENAGAAIVVYGSHSGLQAQGSLFLQPGIGGFDGAQEDEYMGDALTTGDFDGDGYADLGVGIPYRDAVQPSPVLDAGAVRVYFAYAPEVMEVSATVLDVTGIEGQPVSELPSFRLSNGAGSRTLHWRAEVDVPWLSLIYTDTLHVPLTVTVGIDTTGLAQGVHTGRITLLGESMDGTNKTITVNLTLGDGGAPILSVSPPVLQFAAAAGGAAVPLTATIMARNLGPGSLTWDAAVTAGSDWLEIDGPTGGTAGEAADGAGSELVIRPKGVTALAPGVYIGQVTITSPGTLGSPQRIQAILEVSRPPILSTNSRQRLFNLLYEDGDQATQTILLANSGGGGSIAWTAAATELSGSGWLRLGSSSGQTPGQLAVTVDAASLQLGQVYKGKIEIASPQAPGSPQILDVTLKYGTNLRFAPTPDGLTFYMVRGAAAPPAQAITVAASAGKVRSFAWRAAATSDGGWLAVDKTEGSAATATAMQVYATPGTLPIGRYLGRIDFAGEIAQGLPRTVPAQFVIAEKELAATCQQADRYLVDRATASLKLENVAITPNPDGTCAISAELVVKLPQKNTFRLPLQGTIDIQNRLVAQVLATSVTVKIASLQLTLNNLRLNDQTLTADAAWNLGKLSPLQPSAGKITIDRTGLSFAGAQSFTFNPAIAVDAGGFNVTVQSAKLKLDTAAAGYGVELTGAMSVKAGKIASNANVVLELNSAGIHRAQVSAFTLRGVAGLDLSIQGAALSGGSLVATRASFVVPKAWGGSSVALTGVKITKAGGITIGGGSFALPNIKAGDGFSLTGLSGSFATDKGDLIIAADGRFSLPLGEGKGGCTLEVGVTLRASRSLGSVLEIRSAPPAGSGPLLVDALAVEPAAADGLDLNRIKLGVWDCALNVAIPVGSSGFFLTGVRGTIILDDVLQSVKVEIQVRTAAQVGKAPLIYSEGAATINTRPRSLLLEAVVYTAGTKAIETAVYIDKNGMSATFVYDYMIYHADVTVNTWRSAGRFYITGTGNANAVLRAGIFGESCVDAGYKEFCTKLPPQDWRSPSARAEFGTFSDGAFGLKGLVEYKLEQWKVTLINFRGGFYVDDRGRLTFGNVDKYTLPSRPQVLAAKALYAARARGEVVTAASPLDGQVDFAANGDVLLSVPLEEPIRAADAEVPYTTTLRSDLLFALAQPLTGTLTFALIDPTGAAIRPDNLPDNVAYQRDATDDQVQLTYGVAKAMPGTWKMRIGGDTDNIDYVVMVLGNEPPPLLSGVQMAATGDPDQVRVDWRVQSGAQDVKVNIYANPGPLTRTVTLTEPGGFVTTDVVELFTGIPLTTALAAKTNGVLDQALVSLAPLATGTYHLWLEADDGRNPPARQQIATVQIDRRTTFPAEGWTTAVDTLEDTSSGDVQVKWNRHSHPDVGGYRVRLRSADPADPAQSRVEEQVVGDTNVTVLDALEPGRTYWIAIGAEDVTGNRIAWSQETAVTTAQLDFTIDLAPGVLAGAAADTLLNGVEDAVPVQAGAEKAIPLLLQLPDGRGYAVILGVDYAQLPAGINVTYDQEIVAASGIVNLRVTAVGEHAPGYYTLPVIATAGSLVRTLGVVLDVRPPSQPLHLPLIAR